MLAGPFHEEKNGHLIKIVKDGKYVYGFDDESVEKINENGAILFYDDLSHYVPEQIKPFENVIKNRNYTAPIFSNFHDLNNLWLVIITTLPDNSKTHNVSDISYLYESYEIYDVNLGVEEFKKYFIKEKTENLQFGEGNTKLIDFLTKFYLHYLFILFMMIQSLLQEFFVVDI